MDQDSQGHRQFSFRVRWTIGIRLSTLKLEHKALALILATWMRSDGSRCYPDVAKIANAVGRSERTVQRWISGKLEGRWLAVQRRSGRGHANTYRPIIPAAMEPIIEAELGGNGDKTGGKGDVIHVGLSAQRATSESPNGDAALSINGDTQGVTPALAADKSGEEDPTKGRQPVEGLLTDVPVGDFAALRRRLKAGPGGEAR